MSDCVITTSSGNVFEDLGLPDSDEMLVKSHLAIIIQRLIESRGLTQTKAAQVVGLTQSMFSDSGGNLVAVVTNHGQPHGHGVIKAVPRWRLKAAPRVAVVNLLASRCVYVAPQKATWGPFAGRDRRGGGCGRGL